MLIFFFLLWKINYRIICFQKIYRNKKRKFKLFFYFFYQKCLKIKEFISPLCNSNINQTSHIHCNDKPLYQFHFSSCKYRTNNKFYIPVEESCSSILKPPPRKCYTLSSFRCCILRIDHIDTSRNEKPLLRFC